MAFEVFAGAGGEEILCALAGGQNAREVFVGLAVQILCVLGQGRMASEDFAGAGVCVLGSERMAFEVFAGVTVRKMCALGRAGRAGGLCWCGGAKDVRFRVRGIENRAFRSCVGQRKDFRAGKQRPL